MDPIQDPTQEQGDNNTQKIPEYPSGSRLCVFHPAVNSANISRREPINRFTGRNIARLQWKPKVHGRVHNSPSLVPILSQTHPLRTLPSYFFKVHFNVRPIHHSCLNLPSGLFPSAFSVLHQNHVRISLICHACHMPAHLILLDLSILKMFEVPHFAFFFARLLFHLSMLTLLPEHTILEYL
jgi:hypothetical protein